VQAHEQRDKERHKQHGARERVVQGEVARCARQGDAQHAQHGQQGGAARLQRLPRRLALIVDAVDHHQARRHHAHQDLKEKKTVAVMVGGQ
jgi:hypothetical protein